jgi:hypothetical protein
MPSSCFDSTTIFDNFEPVWPFFLKQGTSLLQAAHIQTMFTFPEARKVLTLLFID